MSVDVVAVDVDPTMWASFCEECETYVSEPTEDDKLAHKKGLVHLAKVHPDFKNSQSRFDLPATDQVMCSMCAHNGGI